MVREAGYRVILADYQMEAPADISDFFDTVYPLNGWVQRFVQKNRSSHTRQEEADHTDGEIGVETPLRIKPCLWRLLHGYLTAKKLYRIIQEEKPGIMHFQSMTAGAMTAYYLLKSMGWPESGHRPGLITHLWGYKPRFPQIRRREIMALKSFDYIHTSSPAVARLYRENYEVPAGKISVFVRGINLTTFSPRSSEELSAARRRWGIPTNKFVMIHNRHLHPMYRVDMAVDAFIELARRKYPVFLILVRGSMCQKDYEETLLAKIKEQGLGDCVAMMPPVLSASEMAEALQLSDCSINCVPFDAFPVSILEAMYCRAVPVVRNLESYSQFVKEGETAFAVDGKVEDYVSCIERLIQDSGLKERLATRGAQLVQKEGSEEIFRDNTLNLIRTWYRDW
jgi:glycosyltransferase involved in cell wall biosynthesis